MRAANVSLGVKVEVLKFQCGTRGVLLCVKLYTSYPTREAPYLSNEVTPRPLYLSLVVCVPLLCCEFCLD